jgi:hypothetical protein
MCCQLRCNVKRRLEGDICQGQLETAALQLAVSERQFLGIGVVWPGQSHFCSGVLCINQGQACVLRNGLV